jgi:dTDP-4-dehydrorhamnose 3,5-epimerase-like enzyme
MKYGIIDLKTNSDPRGALTSVEELFDIPIDIKRIFYMHHVTEDRGGHAHKDTDQVVIPISGSFKIKLFDGKENKIFQMDDCTKALYIPRLTFTDLYDFSPDAVCLVLANTHYDMSKSLRSMEAYMLYLKENSLL